MGMTNHSPTKTLVHWTVKTMDCECSEKSTRCQQFSDAQVTPPLQPVHVGYNCIFMTALTTVGKPMRRTDNDKPIMHEYSFAPFDPRS